MSKYPSYQNMISAAIACAANKKGISRYSIRKYILANYDIPEPRLLSHLNIALKRLVEKGYLIKIKDSFKLSKPAGSKKTHKITYPTYQHMISGAIASGANKKGISQHSILKYILANYDIPETRVRSHIDLALKRLVEKGYLVNVNEFFKLACLNGAR